jgi:hypothetical protein
MGRLTTYVYLREGRSDVTAFGVDVHCGGEAVTGRLGTLYEEVLVAPGVIASKAP